nr:hypothetical protein GCM10020063_076070 [Dactylosporangium thailandense]
MRQRAFACRWWYLSDRGQSSRAENGATDARLPRPRNGQSSRAENGAGVACPVHERSGRASHAENVPGVACPVHERGGRVSRAENGARRGVSGARAQRAVLARRRSALGRAGSLVSRTRCGSC